MPEMCACGRPLHYSDARIRETVEQMIAQLGERVKVSCGGRAWMVPRHFIALHGLRAEELGTPKLPGRRIRRERGRR
ncbi:MAG TPA: hypothetical protein VGF16_16675 [Bryobacteraceae bacterium]|jgi:hypothetical protein